jgi:hypothetical protein
MFHPSRPALLLAGLIALAGCASDYPPLDEKAVEARRTLVTSRDGPLRPELPEPDRPLAEVSAAELERRLQLTRAGQVLLQALRTHGGWDAWRHVRRLVVVVERSLPEAQLGDRGEDDGPPQNGGGAAPAEHEAFPASFVAEMELDLDPLALRLGAARGDWRSGWGVPFRPRTAASPATVYFDLAAPFVFVDPLIQAEYLGVEADGQTSESFDKVRYTLPPPYEFQWCVAYFDQTTHVLRRLLVPEPAGGFRLLFLSEWRPWDDSPLLFAASRRALLLPRRYAHPRPEDLHYLERLRELRIGTAQSLGPGTAEAEGER